MSSGIAAVWPQTIRVLREPQPYAKERYYPDVTGDEPKQRLAAILAADAAGYSRLMAADERATLTALDAARSVFRSAVEANRGRVIDMAGDSVLTVFESAAGAVTAALEIQARLDGALRFRIGVHLGDVLEKPDGTIYGDGVNIAARLQALAAPGSIAVSGPVHEAVRGRISAEIADLGEQAMKNIPHSVRAWRFGPPGVPQPTIVEPAPALPDRPSIAVLPFTNMSGDPADEYFADGIAEDIITALSRFGRLFVIARNTSFTFRGRSVDVPAVARQLGVHFVLEGSVRRASNRVRINAQLIEGRSGAHVWAQRYDDVIDDVFDVQERITGQVVASMVPEIEAEEMRQLEQGQRRFTEADDISWRAWKKLLGSYFAGLPGPAREAEALAEQAIARDAKCWLAYFVLSSSHVWRVFMGWAENRAESVQVARRAADMMVLLAPTEARSYFARANAVGVAGNHQQALADRRKAAELNPNDASVAFYLSWGEAAAGNTARAKALAAQALRMSPRDIWVGVAQLACAVAAFLERDFEVMRKWAELAIQSQPTAPIRRVLMIAYAAEAGDAELLKLHQDKLESLAPDFVPSVLRGDLLPFHRPEDMQKLLESLRKAGYGKA
jgi:adenylate cyclase